MKKGIKKILPILSMILLLSMGHGMAVSAEMKPIDGNNMVDMDATGTENPANPVHHCTQLSDDSDYTDWSYVYFGSYPQSEVTGSALTSAIIGASYDANGDAWVNGTKYRRISEQEGYYDDVTYRYFKWERIKWKVLEKNDSTLFVMADKGLDCKSYHDELDFVTWETCTLRGWLNEGFYQTAFSGNEQNAIIQQNVVNENHPIYGTAGGNNTADKVFLLSYGEVTNREYGFCDDYSVSSVSRRIKVSDYAQAMGAYACADSNNSCVGNCEWRLRSLGEESYDAMVVEIDGYIETDGAIVFSSYTCVPALRINLSSTLWYTSDDGTSGAGGSIGNSSTVVNNSSSQTVKPELENNTPGQESKRVALKKVKLKKVRSTRKRSIKITWQEDKNAVGYEMYLSLHKKFKSHTLRRTYPKYRTMVTVVGLSRKKRWYVKIRSYAKAGNEIYYGEWSKTKSVKIK